MAHTTVEDRNNDRKIIADLLTEFRSKQSEMMIKFRKEFDENEQIITKIQSMLKPY